MTKNVKLQEQVKELQDRLAKTEKTKKVLMDRVERSVDSAGDSYSMFERNILLQQKVE